MRATCPERHFSSAREGQCGLTLSPGHGTLSLAIAHVIDCAYQCFTVSFEGVIRARVADGAGLRSPSAVSSVVSFFGRPQVTIRMPFRIGTTIYEIPSALPLFGTCPACTWLFSLPLITCSTFAVDPSAALFSLLSIIPRLAGHTMCFP